MTHAVANDFKAPAGKGMKMPSYWGAVFGITLIALVFHFFFPTVLPDRWWPEWEIPAEDWLTTRIEWLKSDATIFGIAFKDITRAIGEGLKAPLSRSRQSALVLAGTDPSECRRVCFDITKCNDCRGGVSVASSRGTLLRRFRSGGFYFVAEILVGRIEGHRSKGALRPYPLGGDCRWRSFAWALDRRLEASAALRSDDAIPCAL